MTVGSRSHRLGTRVIPGESRDLAGDGPLRLLERLLVGAADRRHPPVERAVLLARLSRRLNALLVAGAPPGRLRTDVLHTLRAEHDRLLHDEVLPELREHGMTIVRWEQVSTAERHRLRTIFDEVIYPLATPMLVDSTHPFPQLAGVPLNIGVFVRDNRRPIERFACVPLPGRLFGLGLLNGGFMGIGAGRLIGVELVVCALLDGFFPGMQVLEKSSFRVIRDGPSVRSVARTACSRMCLEVDETTSERMLNVLVRNLDVGADAVYRGRTPLALAERIGGLTRPAVVDPAGTELAGPRRSPPGCSRCSRSHFDDHRAPPGQIAWATALADLRRSP